MTLDPDFYAEHGARFQKDQDQLEDPQECIEAITTASSSILYLSHDSAVVRLTRRGGPGTVFKVFGSPYSPSINGNWAFGYETTTDAETLWDQIPQDTDLVVTHTPPYSHCDKRATGGPVGCAALRQALQRVRPKLAVCGHVHESRGYERVRWGFSSSETEPEAKDQVVVVPGVLPPPGSKKQSLVDLTGRKAPRLDNVWSWAHGDCTTSRMDNQSLVSDAATKGNRIAIEKRQMTAEEDERDGDHGHDDSDHAIRAPQRQETCIVNAAILGTSWPHRGGKRFHTPIVVDLELPVQNEL